MSTLDDALANDQLLSPIWKRIPKQNNVESEIIADPLEIANQLGLPSNEIDIPFAITADLLGTEAQPVEFTHGLQGRVIKIEGENAVIETQMGVYLKIIKLDKLKNALNWRSRLEFARESYSKKSSLWNFFYNYAGYKQILNDSDAFGTNSFLADTVKYYFENAFVLNTSKSGIDDATFELLLEEAINEPDHVKKKLLYYTHTLLSQIRKFLLTGERYYSRISETSSTSLNIGSRINYTNQLTPTCEYIIAAEFNEYWIATPTVTNSFGDIRIPKDPATIQEWVSQGYLTIVTSKPVTEQSLEG